MKALAIMLPLGVAVSMLYAYVALVLWRWFIVPTGAPDLAYWQAFGAMLCVALLTQTLPFETEDKSLDERLAYVIANTLRPLFALGIGWVALQIWTAP